MDKIVSKEEYEKMYPCESENQKELDKLNIKSKCCDSEILADSADDWTCNNCGKDVEHGN